MREYARTIWNREYDDIEKNKDDQRSVGGIIIVINICSVRRTYGNKSGQYTRKIVTKF